MEHDGPKNNSDEPIEIYGKFPAWYVKYHVWAELTPTEAKLLAVLCVLAHNTTHICMPSWKTLSKLSGGCFSSVGKAMKGLEARGLIRRWRKGNRIRYHLEFHPPEWLVVTSKWVVEEDKVPSDSESYSRDSGNGRFIPNNSDGDIPECSEASIPGESEAARSLSQYEK